jgi:hypothetical protein
MLVNFAWSGAPPGGRGQITDMQQSRYGEQLFDVFLSF